MERTETIRQIQEICKEYADVLGMVVLFGSFARGEQTDSSDIDLYIEARDENITTSALGKNKRFISFRNRMYSVFPQEFDFLAYGGRRDIANIKKSRLWNQIEKDGIVLYDKRTETI